MHNLFICGPHIVCDPHICKRDDTYVRCTKCLLNERTHQSQPAYIYAVVWAYFANRLRIKVTVNIVKPIQAVWHVIILQDS